MSISCSYQPDNNLITVLLTGRLSDQFLPRWVSRLAAYLPSRAPCKLLIDCSSLTDVSQLTAAAIYETAQIRYLRERAWAGVAIVVTRNVTCGLSNMFLAYTWGAASTVSTFRDHACARDFLDRDTAPQVDDLVYRSHAAS